MSLHKKSNRQQNQPTRLKDKQMKKKEERKWLHNSIHIDREKSAESGGWRPVGGAGGPRQGP